MNEALARRGLTLVFLIFLAFLPGKALAATTAQFWEEIGGSASGPGISGSVLGVVPEHRNSSMVIDADGRPIVAYTDWADIVVKRWNGVEWETILQPGGGHLPQLVQDANGRIFLGWMEFVNETNSWEVYLLARDPLTGDWTQLGGSGTGGGISAADGRADVNSFSLALGPDGTPWVAYDTRPTAGADFTTATSGIALNSQQIYVKHWTGPSGGWVYVGTGRAGGGATNVPSFVFSNPNGSANFALHGALSPALAVRGDGSPVLAFVYTSEFQTGNPPQFNGLNDDIYALTWTGGAWVPMGPAIPTAPAGAGLGGPGGISNDGGWSVENFIDRLNRPYMIIGRDGAPVLAWGETSDTDNLRRIYVRRWTGTAWQGFGSASGELAMSSVAFDVSLAPGVNGPIAAWAAGGGLDSSIYVRGWDARVGRWTEFGIGSGTGTGVSGAERRSHTPWITVDPAGTPSVTWIQARDIETGGQTFVRTFDARVLSDLTITAMTAPATARTGGTIAVATTVRNLGMQPSVAVPLNFYLSTGTAPGAGDVLLGSRPITAMGVNGTSAATTMLTLPPSVEPGAYHLLAIVDEANAATERNENNNVRASALTVMLFRPELSFTAFSVPVTGATGRTLAITNTVKNTGLAPATAFTVRFYLSSDDTLDAGDTLLGSRTLTSLAAGASSAVVTSLTIPANTSAPATYRVIGVVDADNSQFELDEDNNVAVSGPVDVSLYRPDLMMTAVTMPATGATGRPLAITNTVRNGGLAPAGAFTVRLYLSNDPFLEPDGDVLLASRVVTSLAAGASNTAVTTVTIPANTSAPGSYYVIAVADALDQQVETDETNNVLVSPATVAIALYRPDLTVTALTMPATGATGRPLVITNTVRNNGPAPAGAFTVRLYLSADATLDTGDVLLGSRAIGSLAAGASSMAPTTVTIPANTSAPGNYYVIAVADALDQQVETDESNNTFVSPATVAIALYRPDLVVTTLTTPAFAAAGRPLAITNTVQNAGPAPATAFTISFYLSTDATLDASDVLLGTRTLGGLAAGASSPAVTTVTIPGNTSVPASYRILAVVDALGQQTENDETNNVKATAAMTITPYLPDLQVTALSAPAGATAGHTLALQHTVSNTGTGPAGTFSVRFYLSADTTLDGGDVLLGTRVVPGLAANTSSPALTVVTVPASAVVPNPYRVLAVVDALGQQTELSESNNVFSTPPLAAGTGSATASAR